MVLKYCSLFLSIISFCYIICLTRCDMFGMWYAREGAHWECGMWDARDVECSGCGMFGMWDVQNVECLGCGMFGMWDVLDVGCSGCGMWVVDLQNVVSSMAKLELWRTFPSLLVHFCACFSPRRKTLYDVIVTNMWI